MTREMSKVVEEDEGEEETATEIETTEEGAGSPHAGDQDEDDEWVTEAEIFKFIMYNILLT
jgi:hypothetical protein